MGRTRRGREGAGCKRVGPSSGFHFWSLSPVVVWAAQHRAAVFTAGKIADGKPHCRCRAFSGGRGQTFLSPEEAPSAATGCSSSLSATKVPTQPSSSGLGCQSETRAWGNHSLASPMIVQVLRNWVEHVCNAKGRWLTEDLLIHMQKPVPIHELGFLDPEN